MASIRQILIAGDYDESNWELFPGRPKNAGILGEYGEALQAGEAPVAIWHKARRLAVSTT